MWHSTSTRPLCFGQKHWIPWLEAIFRNPRRTPEIRIRYQVLHHTKMLGEESQRHSWDSSRRRDEDSEDRMERYREKEEMMQLNQISLISQRRSDHLQYRHLGPRHSSQSFLEDEVDFDHHISIHTLHFEEEEYSMEQNEVWIQDHNFLDLYKNHYILLL